ncbi:MAG: hypothetical protein LUG93_13485 [Lachnospiraceae bacterium]|nr:hypothetical protein [Lachnospiraceae bacterium]MCD7956728.1 hypothetical protein [Lachnospiraceae bacterium]
MSIMSKWNTLVQKNRDAATLSVYEMRALTNFHEACHGDFAYLPEQHMNYAEEEYTEAYPENNRMWRAAFAR